MLIEKKKLRIIFNKISFNENVMCFGKFKDETYKENIHVTHFVKKIVFIRVFAKQKILTLSINYSLNFYLFIDLVENIILFFKSFNC